MCVHLCTPSDAYDLSPREFSIVPRYPSGVQTDQQYTVHEYILYTRCTRVQPLTRGPEDDETKTMTVARPQHVCMPLSERRQHHAARSTCADAPVLRSSPLGADMVGKSRNMSADVLFMPGLLALMPPTICCVRSQSVRDFVTEISGGATPAPVRCGSEL